MLFRSPVYGLTLAETVEMLQGQAGTTVDIVAVRQGQDPFRLTLTRQAMAEPAVTWRTRGNEGYIRIPYFTPNVTAQVTKAVQDLNAKLGPKLEGVIFDLRGTPGGSAEAAIQLADAFLADGVIASIKGRADGDSKTFKIGRAHV